MWLKIFTSTMLVLTVLLTLNRPALVGPLPKHPVKRADALHYSERALVFTVALLGTLVGGGVGSIVLVRQANKEYRRLAMENMQSLIEGAIADQKQMAEKSDE